MGRPAVIQEDQRYRNTLLLLCENLSSSWAAFFSMFFLWASSKWYAWRYLWNILITSTSCRQEDSHYRNRYFYYVRTVSSILSVPLTLSTYVICLKANISGMQLVQKEDLFPLQEDHCYRNTLLFACENLSSSWAAFFSMFFLRASSKRLAWRSTSRSNGRRSFGSSAPSSYIGKRNNQNTGPLNMLPKEC